MDPVTETPTEPVDYAALNAVWGALATGMLLATKDDAPPASELPIFGLATFALTKALAKEKVGTWVRDPLVEESGGEDRRPKGRRLRYAAGELLTCTRCSGGWAALAVVGLRLHAPATGRTVATVLAASAANDFLHSAFSWLCARADTQAHDAQATSVQAERLSAAQRAS